MRGLTAGELSDFLRFAFLSGFLNITDLYVPAGFSGGGAYIDVPATVLNPGASPDAPGKPLCSLREQWCQPRAFPYISQGRQECVGV